MFIGRNSLRSELTADPIRFFRQYHAHSAAERGQGCRESADASADNGNVADEFRGACQESRKKQAKALWRRGSGDES